MTLAPTPRDQYRAVCPCGWTSHPYIRPADAQARGDLHDATCPGRAS